MKLHNGNLLYSPMVGNFASWFVAFLIMSFYVNDYTDNRWLMIIGIFVGSQWTLWLHGFREAERIEVKKMHINHDLRFWQRLGVCIFIGVATHLLADGLHPVAFIKAIACAIFLSMIVWLEFDSFLSLNRNLPWDYISADPRGAETDVFFYDKKGLWVASKVIGLIIGIELYYWILELPL